MNTRRRIPVFILFFISGFAALIYQVAWQRSLFTLLGSNIESTTVIVTVFMLGLGCGALLGGKLSRVFSSRTLLLFALIETAIGLYGLLSISLIHSVATMAISSQPEIIAAALGILLPPTLLMGASLPLLTTYINSIYSNAGVSLGGLYFYNTLGAAFASFLTVLILFEALGLKGTVYFAGSLNVLVGAGALLLLRRSP